MRKTIDALLGIPRERIDQFRLIGMARKCLLQCVCSEGVPLAHVEFVMPFVETDFSLSAWLFYTTRLDVQNSETDGTSGRLKGQLQRALTEVGYPAKWLPLVTCRFASKEEVDSDFQGSYSYYASYLTVKAHSKRLECDSRQATRIPAAAL